MDRLVIDCSKHVGHTQREKRVPIPTPELAEMLLAGEIKSEPPLESLLPEK